MGRPRLIILIRHAQSEGNSTSPLYTLLRLFITPLATTLTRLAPQKAARSTRQFPTIV